MRRRRLSYDERAYIDVVPLVDTLLAVFLYKTMLPTYILYIHGIFNSILTFYFCDYAFFCLSQVEEELKSKKPKTMVIEADEDVAHKFVVALMDVGKKSGVENVLIGVRKVR